MLPSEEFAKKKSTCLVYHNEDEFSLDKNHSYYYQMQLQMFVTNAKYCDFEFFNECLEKSLDFHKYVIKPELLSKFFTTKCGAEKIETWCICKKPDDVRPMLRCDNEDCKIGWFHFDCIGLNLKGYVSKIKTNIQTLKFENSNPWG
ncbi:hypothetical protein NQ317_012979 [Molorchus minor]|uniref:Zinc finger PHD-type domain-containing protein n=1 Tax=Molorchus minor TaxID=1323400 RepID=A0ABQ9JF59_9CUCU|nr:hypothetical protein NQ317_012979 [Molorchus minor]